MSPAVRRCGFGEILQTVGGKRPPESVLRYRCRYSCNSTACRARKVIPISRLASPVQSRFEVPNCREVRLQGGPTCVSADPRVMGREGVTDWHAYPDRPEQLFIFRPAYSGRYFSTGSTSDTTLIDQDHDLCRPDRLRERGDAK